MRPPPGPRPDGPGPLPSRRVHISQSTMDCLKGEFDVEPGDGGSRCEYLDEKGIETYLIIASRPEVKKTAARRGPAGPVSPRLRRAGEERGAPCCTSQARGEAPGCQRPWGQRRAGEAGGPGAAPRAAEDAGNRQRGWPGHGGGHPRPRAGRFPGPETRKKGTEAVRPPCCPALAWPLCGRPASRLTRALAGRHRRQWPLRN